MKKLNTLILFIILFSHSFLLSNEEEKKETYEKNGELYYINNESMNISKPQADIESTDEINILIEPTIPKEKSKYKLYPVIGQISPLGTNLRNKYDPGFSVGLIIQPEKTFKFFKKEWNIDVDLSFLRLSPHVDRYDVETFNIVSLVSYLSSNFGPLILSFGIGISDTESYQQKKAFFTGSFNIGYKVMQNKNSDIILNLKFKEIFGAPRYSGSTSKGTSELYSLSLQFGIKI